MAPPIRPSVPLSQPLPSGSFHKPLILIHQRMDRKKTTITENLSNLLDGPQPCLTQWNYEPHLVGPTQDRWVMVESFDKMWSTGEGNGKPLQYSCLENFMNSMKRQNDMTLKDELPRLISAHYATGEEWRNNSRKNKEMEPKRKQHPVVGVTGDGSKVWCYKGQYRIGTWNVRSMNQGKLEVVQQEAARVNINIHTLLYTKRTTNKDLLCSTENSTQCLVINIRELQKQHPSEQLSYF